MRASRNVCHSRTRRVTSMKTESISCPSTAVQLQTLPTAGLKRKADESKPLRGTAKRPRTENESPVSTPRKARKLSHRVDASSMSTPESMRYDSGIEMTPESAAKERQEDINATPSSPCNRKHRTRLSRRQSPSDAFDQNLTSGVRKETDFIPNDRRRSPRVSQEATSCSDARSGKGYVAEPVPCGEVTAARYLTKDACPKTFASSKPGLYHSIPPSEPQRNNNAAHIDHQTIWQPAGNRQDMTVLLSILGETVVQQQRTRTTLQRWLRSHDDHLMFWLNYGGTSSPSDYLRWTKRVRSDCESMDA